MPSPRLTTSAAIARGLLPRKLLDMVERAEKDVQAMIKAAPDRAAASAKERQELYDRIKARYAELARELGASLHKGAKTATEDEAAKTARMIPRAKPFPLTREQMVTALNGKTAGQLVATATSSMSDNAVRHLRNAAVRAFGRAAVEGLNTNETHKALQEEWDKEAGDDAAFRFVDKRGAAWSNARYLQMLIRTTNAEVRRNTMANTFVQNGQDLARISEDSDTEGLCDACARWQGKIVSLTGATEGFPTLEDAKADGLFHPNCTHRLEYLDEEETQEALAERDKRLGKQEPEDESGDSKPPEPRKKATGGDEDTRKQAESEARQSIADLGNIGNRAQNITDKASADKAIADMKAVIERAEKQEAAAQGTVREALRKALEAARKKFDDVRADAILAHGGSVEENTFARMHKLGFQHTDETLSIDGVNPNYSKERSYQVNCQRCVVASEARSRGYDVEAKPSDGNSNVTRFWAGWSDHVNCRGGSLFKANAERVMMIEPDGARFVVRVKWRHGGAHFFTAIKENGSIRYENPQDPSLDASEFFSRAGTGHGQNWVWRVDNREFTDQLGDAITRPGTA